MAAVLMNKLATERSLNVRIESAGIFAADGEPATDEAIEVMRDFGIDLSGHRSKRITAELADASDLILTMTAEQKRMFGENRKVHTLSEYAGSEGDIADPYGGGIDVYRKTAEQILKAEERVALRLDEENV